MNDPQKKYRRGTVMENVLLEDLNRFHGANPTLSSDVDQHIAWKTPNSSMHHQSLRI